HRPAKAGVVDAHEVDELPFRCRPEGVDDEHGGGLSHRFYDQDPRHDRAYREMTLKIMFVDRYVLDAGRPLVGHGIDYLVDRQKRVAMRDHFHDPLYADLNWRGFGKGRLDHPSP